MLVEPGMKVTEIDPADLRARVEVALEMTAHTLDPPVSDDFTTLLGVVTRRLELLPDGGTVPVDQPLDEDDVDRMVEEFLASPRGRRPLPRRPRRGGVARRAVDRPRHDRHHRRPRTG